MKRLMWAAVAVLAVIAIGIATWMLRSQPPVVVSEPATPPAVAEEPAPAPPEAPTEPPAVAYPIAPQEGPASSPLPPLGSSDGPLRDALGAVISSKAFAEFFFTEDIVRRFVVTVDNLPRENVVLRLRSARPIPGKFEVTAQNDRLSIAPSNSQRYSSFIRLVQTTDPKALVSVYRRFYPVIQEQYQSLGYPGRYFNDRLVAAIDDMLAAPDAKGPVGVVQPKVLYSYADSEIESLSAGQRIMIRMGPDNASQVKAKLRAIRRELTGPIGKP